MGFVIGILKFHPIGPLLVVVALVVTLVLGQIPISPLTCVSLGSSPGVWSADPVSGTMIGNFIGVPSMSGTASNVYTLASASQDSKFRAYWSSRSITGDAVPLIEISKTGSPVTGSRSGCASSFQYVCVTATTGESNNLMAIGLTSQGYALYALLPDGSCGKPSSGVPLNIVPRGWASGPGTTCAALGNHSTFPCFVTLVASSPRISVVSLQNNTAMTIDLPNATNPAWTDSFARIFADPDSSDAVLLLLSYAWYQITIVRNAHGQVELDVVELTTATPSIHNVWPFVDQTGESYLYSPFDSKVASRNGTVVWSGPTITRPAGTSSYDCVPSSSGV